MAFYVDVVGAELVWRIRDGKTVVANVRVNATGPALLLANHLDGDVPILIFRVDNLEKLTAALRRRGWKADGEPFEIPHGPCIVFRDPNGQRLALYQLVRPEVDARFAGRVDR